MRDIHLAEIVVRPKNRIGTIVGHEPRQTLHIPSHVLLGRKVQVSARAAGTMVVLGERYRLVVSILGIEILIGCRREGIETKDGIGDGSEIHEVSVGSGTVQRIDGEPGRGVRRLEDIILRRTRSTCVLVGIKV